jgi:hypothetical protein
VVVVIICLGVASELCGDDEGVLLVCSLSLCRSARGFLMAFLSLSPCVSVSLSARESDKEQGAAQKGE